MAGAGYKLFNTGDVLTAAQVNTYLNEQTVMVFASSTARTTALSGVLAEGMVSYLQDTNAVEVYNGSAWVGLAADQTPLTTKGDLFTFSTVDARLAVGNNGETLVADSSTSTGLRYQTTANSNALINGALEIWQRNTTVAGSSTNFTADRWQAYRAVAGSTFSRQNTSDTTNLPFIQYCVRVQRDSGNSATNGIYLGQNLESATSRRFAGQPVVISFYARKGADYSAASNGLNIQVKSGTGTDQNIFAGLTGEASVINQTATLTATWQRFEYTATVSASATQLAVFAQYAPVGTASTNDYFEITGIQLELGSVATGFKRSGGTLAGELAACQRYYLRYPNVDVYTRFAIGDVSLTTKLEAYIFPPQEMRVVPTSVDTSGTGSHYAVYSANVITPCSIVPSLKASSLPGILVVDASVASGLTSGRAGQLISNNTTSGYLGFSAEL